MNADNDLKKKLEDLLEQIPLSGRKEVLDLISAVLNAGGISENALIQMAMNPLISIELRAKTCWLLPRLEVKDSEIALKSLLEDPNEEIRKEAALSLGLLPHRDVVQILIDSLKNESSKPVKLAAIHALGILSSLKSAPLLMKILQNPHEDDEIKADAAEALAHVKFKGLVELLINSLQDSSPLVRYSAAYALGQQGDENAIPALQKLATIDHANTPWGSVASCAQESLKIILAEI